MSDMVEIPLRKAQAYRELIALILDEMPSATNRDLAADGPVGDEETAVWDRIEAKAREIRDGRWAAC